MFVLILLIFISLDSFFVCMSYGINRIKMPISACMVLAIGSTLFLGVAILMSALIQNIIPLWICKFASFLLLFSLGIYTMFEDKIKIFLKTRTTGFLASIYLNKEKADLDQSKSISIKEACLLSITVSIDSLATGFSMGIGLSSYWLLLCFNFLLCLSVCLIGHFLGTKISKTITFPLSYLAGFILIVLAFFRI